MSAVPSATQSALVVPVPEAEPVVEPWRASLDPAAELGVPAHVTVLYPFVDPAQPLDPVIRRLRTLLVTFHQFRFRLNRVRWFADTTLWLAPEPSSGFRALTEVVGNAWPSLLPYGGAHDEVIPHLTIGDGAPFEDLMRAATRVVPYLPIMCVATQVWLMTGGSSAGSWRVERRFALQP